MTTRRRILSILALAALALFLRPPRSAGRLTAADPSMPPLDRIVTLDLWGATLSEAAKAILEQTGVEVVFFLPDFPGDQNSRSVYLVSGRVNLRAALECLGRRFGFRYRLGDSGRIEVSKGYGWVPPDDYAVRFIRLDPLLRPDGGDLDETRRFLDEFVKPLSLLGGDFSLALARSPAPDNRNSTRAEAVMPPVLADYFDKAVKCLAGEPGDYPAPSDRARSPILRAASNARIDWESLLARDFAAPKDGDFRSSLKNICEQAGVAIVLESPPPGGGVSFTGFREARAPLREIAAVLASRLGMNRRVFLDFGGIAFETGPKAEWENDPRSREFFWTGLGVAGFDARAAAGRAGGGGELAKLLRRDVFPALWRDPAASLGYSPVTGRLAVVAPQNVLEAVARKLAELNGTAAGK